jgi:putative DNA primase/helicase
VIDDGFDDWSEKMPDDAGAQDHAGGGTDKANDKNAANTANAAATSPALISVRASDVQMLALRWLWPGRFACGKVGIIAGLPDEGKGQILYYIAAQVTRPDGRWPCDEGAVEGAGCNVLLLTAEEDINDTVVPRLKAAGADLEHIIIVQMVREKGKKRPFSLVSDLELLRAKIEEHSAKLVLIDPLSAYLGKTDSFRQTQVRNVITPIGDLASETRVAIIGVMHFNKKTDVTNVMLRISDSLAFGAVARHVYGVVRDTNDDGGRRIMVKGKNNLVQVKDKALAYYIDSKSVGMSRTCRRWKSSRLMWSGRRITSTLPRPKL